MSEKIVEIVEGSFKPVKNHWQEFDGFIILTTKQQILLGISNGQGCCEDWGYLMTNDDIKEFVDAEILSITTTDDALKTQEVMNKIDRPYGFDQGGIIFVNINTTKGTLQFVAYNAHNGYYGHTVFIKSNQLTLEEGV